MESSSIIATLIKSWLKGGARLRIALGLSLVFLGLALIVAAAGITPFFNPEITDQIAIVLALISAAIGIVVSNYQRVIDKELENEKIEKAEVRFRENPKETQAAWELAQSKLENYINRNLSQVRSIFWMTVIVMLFGFLLICFGVFKAFSDPELLKPAILSASSGLLVNFIGATFLVIYKSTMSQAQEYMGIIERINAVGMSVQILDAISDENIELKAKSTAELAKNLLGLYSSKQRKTNKKL